MNETDVTWSYKKQEHWMKLVSTVCAEVDDVFWGNLGYANKIRPLGKHTFEVPAV